MPRVGRDIFIANATFPELEEKNQPLPELAIKDLLLALSDVMARAKTFEHYFRVKDGKQRNIVGISSTSGVHGNAGQSNYAFFKAGVVGLMKTIAKEWGPGFNVRANTVAFGYIETRLTQAKEDGACITGPDGEKILLGVPGRDGKSSFEDIPLRRPGSAEDAAKVILAVCSPLFSYVTGQVISVTGGRNM